MTRLYHCAKPCSFRGSGPGALSKHLRFKPDCLRRRLRMLQKLHSKVESQHRLSQNRDDSNQSHLYHDSVPDLGESMVDSGDMSEYTMEEDSSSELNTRSEEVYPDAGSTKRTESPPLSKIPLGKDQNVFYPFSCRTDWEMATWFARSGMSHRHIDRFFKLAYVSCSPPH